MSRLDELLDRYESLREAGQPASLDSICADCPELLDELRERVRALEAMDAFLGAGAGEDALPDAGRYRAVALHARGGLGEVYRAQDEELQREVALKRVQAWHDADPETRARFLREAEITGKLEHPGVVPVYGLGSDAQGRPCYAMRFVRGETLDEAIVREPGARSLIRRFLAVCETVAYAHSRGVLHRDLKPMNILLGPYGETILIDWGLAVAEGDANEVEPLDLAEIGGSVEMTVAGRRRGSPAYMSPEQAAGARATAQSDVYGLGATLYKILTGRAPFEGGTDIFDRVRAGTIERPHGDRALAAICMKALATRPGDRYASAEELARDVERWLADEPVGAWREPLLRRARRWAKRHRIVVAAAAAALVVGAAGLALLAKREREAARTLGKKNVALEDALYRAAVRLADAEVDAGRPRGVREALAKTERRGFAWWHLRRRIGGERFAVRARASIHLLAFRGRKLIPEPGRMLDEDAEIDGSPGIVAWRGDLVLMWRMDKRLYHGSASKKTRTPIEGSNKYWDARGFSIAADGRFAYVQDDTLYIRETSNGSVHHAVRFDLRVMNAWTAFAPDGSACAILMVGQTKLGLERAFFGICDVEARRFRVPPTSIRDFAPGAGARDPRNLYGSFLTALVISGTTGPIAFSPDGTRVVFPDARFGAVILDAHSGKAVGTFARQPGSVACIATFPDGRFLTGHQDRAARIWSADGTLLREFLAHDAPVKGVGVSADGTRFATLSGKTAKVWDAGADQGLRVVAGDGSKRLVAMGDLVGTEAGNVWDPVTRAQVRHDGAVPKPSPDRVRVPVETESGDRAAASAYNADRTLVAVAIDAHERREWSPISVRDARTGEPLLTLRTRDVFAWHDVVFVNGVIVALDDKGRLHFFDGRPLPEDGR